MMNIVICVQIGSILIIALLIIFTIFAFKKKKSWMENSSPVIGEIVDIKKLRGTALDMVDGRSTYQYIITVEYEVDNKTYSYHSNIWHQSDHVGKKVNLYYQKDNPAHVINSAIKYAPIIMSLVLTVVVIVAIVVNIVVANMVG